MRVIDVLIGALVAAALFAGSPVLAGGRVIGGMEITGWTYLFGVRIALADGSCSGVVVAQNWVLTAAHCVDRTGGIRVEGRAGAAEVEEVRLHPGYDRSVPVNDLALLRLALPLVDASIATLASADPTPGDVVNPLGYGGGSKLILGFQRAIACGPSVALSQWCAGRGDDSAACYGDSGGAGLDARGAVAGIVSQVATGCERGGVTVYTAVAAHRDWIDSNVLSPAGRSGWYRQPGVDAQGWSVQFAGDRALVGLYGYASDGSASWTVATLIRSSSSGLFEGDILSCRSDGETRSCSPVGGRLWLAVTAEGVTIKSTADSTTRKLIPHLP